MPSSSPSRLMHRAQTMALPSLLEHNLTALDLMLVLFMNLHSAPPELCPINKLLHRLRLTALSQSRSLLMHLVLTPHPCCQRDLRCLVQVFVIKQLIVMLSAQPRLMSRSSTLSLRLRSFPASQAHRGAIEASGLSIRQPRFSSMLPR